MADGDVAILERSVTERLNVHRRELDKLDEQHVAMRDELHKDLSEIKEALARVEATSDANAQLMSKLLIGIIGAGISIVAAAVGVVAFGPN